MMPYRVLIVEDDGPVGRFLEKSLEAEHYQAELVADGNEAKKRLEAGGYDLMVLDLNLPGTDGLEVLKYLRAKDSLLPVLVLTSRSCFEDKVQTLDLGADDFLPKPFAYSELAARLRALLRRRGPAQDARLRVADLELNRVERLVRRGGRTIELTPKEFALLEFLMKQGGRCASRASIIEHVWKLAGDTMTNVVDVYINYLRKKIDEGFETKLIHTVRGKGYRVGTSAEPSRS